MKAYPNTFFDIEMIDSSALFVLKTLLQKGHKAYLVGGGVRDLLVNIRPKDFDIVTDARPQEVRRCFKRCYLIGRRFRLAHVHVEGKVIEVATFRKGEIESTALITEDNEFGDPEDDAKRRDFTINGLFFDLNENQIIDYVEGIEDIKKRQIATIGNPSARFRQDPVRMLRALKFQAKIGFDIEENTKKALEECLPFIVQSSQARLLEECLRILESSFSATFFRLSLKTKLLHHLFPTLSIFYETQKHPFYYLDIKDDWINQGQVFSRSCLFSLFVFEYFKVHLVTKYEGKKEPHMGQVTQDGIEFLNQLCAGFLHTPKRLKADANFILCSQFRFTPIGSRVKIRNTFFRAKDFLNA